MTMLLENRTISIILTVPEVKELISPISHSCENLNQHTSSFDKNSKPSSIPIYHGSIIRIEQHNDDQNTFDLIVRVPNFHHLSLPLITISSNDDQLSETKSQQDIRIKRRAPICPISNLNQSESNLRLPNTKRLTIGLRNLSRVFNPNCKTKQSTNMNKITIIPVLPDVEVIREIPTLSRKTPKNSNSTSKFLTPKILFIKRKHFNIRKKQTSTNSLDSQTNTDDKTHENTPANISLKDNEIEQSKQNINYQDKSQSTTIEQLIPNIPISLVEPDYSSTHRYSTLSGLPFDSQSTITENPSLTNIFQSNKFISKEKMNLTTDTQSSDYIINDNIEEKLHVVHPNGDTYSECYEVTYELDPEYQQFLDNEKDDIDSSNTTTDQSLIQHNLHSSEYENLASTLTTYIPIPIISSNNYEQIEHNTNLEQQLTIPNISRVKFHSLEDLSETNNEQISNLSIISSSQENDQICPNNTATIDEDYAVIVQFLKRVLQIDTNDQFFQTDEN